MTILIHALGGSAEGALKREAIKHVELFPEHHSGRRLSAFLNSEAAILKRKGRVLLRVQQRKDALLESVLIFERVVTAAIHEDIAFSGVGVEVAVEVNIAAF